MLCMWMMHHLTHQNISFSELGEAKTLAFQAANTGMAIFIVCMMILPAAIKSAQLPFTAWLPRAMEGPTSSSAIFYGSLSVHIGFLIIAYASFLGRYVVGKGYHHHHWCINSYCCYFNCKGAANG